METPNSAMISTDRPRVSASTNQAHHLNMMLQNALVLLSAFAAGAYATANAACAVVHTSVVGNVYTLHVTNVDQGSLSSICGSFDTHLRNAVRNDGGKVKYLNNFCHTDNSNRIMASIVELDKQSPTYQANLVQSALYAGFGSSGVSFSGCDVSRIPV